MSLIIDHTRTIDAPAERVWHVITDFAAYREWNPFCLEADSTMQPGDPINMLVQLGRNKKRQSEVVSTHTPGVEFSYRMKPLPLGALNSRRSHTVTALGPNSTRYESHFELNGWLSPLVSGLLGKALRTGFTGMTDGIVQRVSTVVAD